MEQIAELVLPAQSRAGRREWMALAVLALPTLLVSMDASVTFLALPVLSAALKPSASELLWITDSYTFLQGGLLITMGTLGDRIGRKKLLVIGAIGFAIASAFAAFSTSAEMLILSRGIMGIAGAALLPSTVSLIRSMFHDNKQRAMAIGIWTTCYCSGTMMGPLFGGLLLQHYWWGAAFLIGVPVMLLFLVLGPLLLDEYRSPSPEKFDLFSAFLLLAGFLSVSYGIKRISEQLTISTLPIALIIVGCAILFFCLNRQKHISNPLIDLKLFRLAPFNTTLIALMCSLFCWSGLYIFIAQYLQLIVSLDPMQAGLWIIPAATIGMFSCLGAPLLARSIGKTNVIVTGMVVLAVGILLLLQVGLQSGLALLVPATILLTMGCSLSVTLGVDMIISSVPSDWAGAAAGIYETSTTFGSALGVAILGSIGTAFFRSQMTADPVNTLGEATAIAKEMPAQVAANYLNTAQSAFVYSFGITAGIAAFLMITVIILVARVYRRA